MKRTKYLLLLLCVPFFLTGCRDIPKLENGKDVVVEINGKKFSTEDFYNELKKEYGVNVLVSMVDTSIADMELTDELKEQAKTMVIANPVMFEKMQVQASEQNYSKILSSITALSEVEAELRYSTNPRIVLETAFVKTLNSINLVERVEKIEKMLEGGVQVQSTVMPEKTQQRIVEEPKVSSVKEQEPSIEIVSDNVLLGKLLTYLREHRDMSLLAGVRQVKKVQLNGKHAVFYVDDQLTLDLVSRDKYKPTFKEFFDSLGLTFEFKIEEKRNKGGDIDALASMFGSKFEIKE